MSSSPLVTLFLFLIATSLTGGIGYLIGQTKGRAEVGLFFGLLLGPLGWLAVLAGPDLRSKCPECYGPIPADALICMHCRHDLVEQRPAPRRKAKSRDYGY